MFDHINGFTNNQELNSNHLSFDESLDANYSYFLNSRKRQSNYLIGFNSDFNFDKNKEDNGSLKEINSDFLLSMDLDERFYLSEDQFFFHFGSESDISFSREKEKQTNGVTGSSANTSIFRDWNIQPQIEVGAGLGRIEPVGDFRQAIYIFEELYNSQRLERLPGENEIIRVASKISELKNKRFFDSRLRKIYEIKSIDSLLNNMGISGEQDAVYFTVLNDMWDYGREERYSGTRIQLDLTGGLYYSSEKEESSYSGGNDSDTFKENNESYGIQFKFDSHKPVTLKWQRYFNVETYWKHYTEARFNESSSRISYPHNKFFASAGYGYKWFLNTRTTANFGVYANYSNDYSNEAGYSEHEATSVGLNGSIYYYFSPRLRLIFSTDAQQRWLELPFENKQQIFVLGNHLRINYAIF